MQKAHEIPIESQATAFLQAAGLKQRVLSLESCQHTMGECLKDRPVVSWKRHVAKIAGFCWDLWGFRW
jgi:hypothetical protein